MDNALFVFQATYTGRDNRKTLRVVAWLNSGATAIVYATNSTTLIVEMMVPKLMLSPEVWEDSTPREVRSQLEVVRAVYAQINQLRERPTDGVIVKYQVSLRCEVNTVEVRSRHIRDLKHWTILHVSDWHVVDSSLLDISASSFAPMLDIRSSDS